MTAGYDTSTYAVRVRPKPTLIRSGLLLLLIVPLPIFGVLVLLGLRNGSWPVAVFGEALCILLCVLGFVLYRGIFVGVTMTSIVEHGFFSRRTSALLSEVASMALAHTYSSSTAETLPQLIVRNHHGARLLRLRGIFWTEESMHAIAKAIDGVLELPPEAMTSEEFYERYPGSAYWFENRPVLAVLAIAVPLIMCVGIVLGLMRLLGLPIAGN